MDDLRYPGARRSKLLAIGGALVLCVGVALWQLIGAFSGSNAGSTKADTKATTERDASAAAEVQSTTPPPLPDQPAPITRTRSGGKSKL